MDKNQKYHADVNEFDVSSHQRVFPLTSTDYEHLQQGAPKTFPLAYTILLAGLGYAISLLSTYLLSKTAPPPKPEELITLGIWIVLGLIIYFVGFIFVNKQKRMMKRIGVYFDNNPTQYKVPKK